MNDLKESFKINNVSDLKDLIIKSGKKLNWNPVSISNNNIEFHYSKHLAKFYTIISWSDDGFINLSSNYKKKSIKADLGGYRKNNNEKIKLSILREFSLLEKNTELKENNSIKLSRGETDKNVQKDINVRVEKTAKPDNFSQQIAEKDKSQNKTLIRVAAIGALILISFFVYKLTIGNTCGCSENEIIEIQKSQVMTRAEAIDFCCKLQRAAEKYNNK